MTVVSLQIVEPVHGAVLVAPAAVRLRGSVLSTGHPPLFYRWYSSLHVPTGIATAADAPRAALNFAAGSTLDFSVPLKLGSHVVTLAARDVAGDDPPALQGVKDAGMAGGPPAPGVPQPCVVHVLAANLLSPGAGSIARAALVLKAEAPVKWADATYAALNRIAYAFVFTPTGAPAGRSVVELTAAASDLAFEAATSTLPPAVRWQSPLPAALGTGGYSLTLRVFDRTQPATRHEVSVAVTLT